LMARLIVLFNENMPRLLNGIRLAVAHRSAADIAFGAHALLSYLGVFGAFQTSDLARELETQANCQDYEHTDRTFAALERGTTDIHAALAVLAAG